MNKRYDYLIIGAGLYGSIFAHEATKKGKKCLVIEKRPHIGGNIYEESCNGIGVHKYGPTSSTLAITQFGSISINLLFLITT